MKREKLEISYSIGVLIAIPVLVMLNTVLLINSTRNAFNVELQRKSGLVNSVIAQSSLGLIEDQNYTQLEENLKALEANEPSIVRSAVYVEKDGTLEQVAKSELSPKQINDTTEQQINIARDRKQPIATLIDVTDRDGNTAQAWSVATPAVNANNDVIAVVSTSLVTTDAQEIINSAYQASFFVLIASLAVIVGLLFRHFRLVGYIDLLAKQKELNQTMGDFLSVATHELKAPTSIIKGYLSNVTDGLFGPVDDKLREPINVAISQTDRLNSLVQDLLNVSRVEQGRISYNITQVDSATVLSLVTENYKTLANNKGLELIYQPSGYIPPVLADEGRLQEIYTNIIDNAIKYTANGNVLVTQTAQKNVVITSIKDTGFGISPESKKRLFQRFYRIKTAETQNISGTGLGLWIIKQYITAMGGTIDIESMEGVGSNFIVTLPIDKKHPPSKPKSDLPPIIN